MRYLIYSFLVMICVAAPVFACEPPEFPKPDDVAQMEMIESRKGELTDTEKAALAAYRADRQRYTELFDQAYPCPLAAGAGVPRMQAGNNAPLVEELNVLKDKWNRTETLPEHAPPADSDEFIDVPAEEMLTIE